MQTTIYSKLDKGLPEVKNNLRREFNRLSLMGFDELNVLNTRKTTAQMYKRLSQRNERLYLDGGYFAYLFAFGQASQLGFAGERRKIDAKWVESYLQEYNPVTRYIYEKEVERRRMRLNECILTDREFDSRENFQTDIRRSANYWWTQTLQYGIGACDAAMLDAFRDCGVKRVRWVTMEDNRVCDDCDKRDGVVYDIDKVPPKEHYGCRCILVPVRG